MGPERGVATDTPESILQQRPRSVDRGHPRPDVRRRPAACAPSTPSETKVLSMAIKAEPGMTMCSTWTVTDHQGETISVGFVARANPETQDDGSERLICRAMNWRAEPEGPSCPRSPRATDPRRPRASRSAPRTRRPGQLDTAEVARRARAVLRLACERDRTGSRVNPADALHMARMTLEFANGSTSGVLRLRTNDGGWTPCT